MSEHDIKVWRESATQSCELDSETLLKRLVRRSYAHGWVGKSRGLDHPNAENLEDLVGRDWDEITRRLS